MPCSKWLSICELDLPWILSLVSVSSGTESSSSHLSVHSNESKTFRLRPPTSQTSTHPSAAGDVVGQCISPVLLAPSIAPTAPMQRSTAVNGTLYRLNNSWKKR